MVIAMGTRIKRHSCGYFEDGVEYRAAFVGCLSIIEIDDDKPEHDMAETVMLWERQMMDIERQRVRRLSKKLKNGTKEN